MAKIERTLNGDFDDILKRIESGILEGSISASYEDGSDFASENYRCSVRVFERYSYMGNNRVSLTLTMFKGMGDEIMLSAITSGGSQAMFFKINTIGENAFLEKLNNVLDELNR